MRTNTPQSTRLGDLVAAAFDEAARQSTDPREVSILAAQAVNHLLLLARSAGERIASTALSRPAPRRMASAMTAGGRS